MLKPEILILGGPNSGKTHFAGQILGRLQRAPGSLKINLDHGSPTDLSSLKEVLTCLENGKAASHTPTNTQTEINLPIISDDGVSFNLNWPDYAGEQIKQIFNFRIINDYWKSKLLATDSWILLIRLKAEIVYPTSLNDPEKLIQKTGDHVRPDTWDANAYWVEILQLLLQVAKKSTTNRLKHPKLAILLSCYDEIDDRIKTPSKHLQEKLPLFFSFLKNNWSDNFFSVWGLSALGQSLDLNSRSDAFIDNGPETQGWVVQPNDVGQNSDLTLPISWLLSDYQK